MGGLRGSNPITVFMRGSNPNLSHIQPGPQPWFYGRSRLNIDAGEGGQYRGSFTLRHINMAKIRKSIYIQSDVNIVCCTLYNTYAINARNYLYFGLL